MYDDDEGYYLRHQRSGPQYCPDCDAEWSAGDHCVPDCPGRDDQPEEYIEQQAARYCGAAGQSAYFGVGYPIP